MTKDLLNQLILMAEKCHAKVRVMVCDMGNTKLLKELNVYRIKCHYFPNPIDQSRKVYIVTCIPHCFKNLRNNTLDYKLIYNAPDGKEVRLGKEIFSQFNGQKISLRQASDPLGRVQRLVLKKTSTTRSQNR